MSLLAEEIVEEWLNRAGFFTIRGVKLGVQEIDLLAIRPSESGMECRHVEVQASVRPVSYLTDLPKAIQRATGRRPKSAKQRTPEELSQGVEEWISRKWDHPEKTKLRARLVQGAWSRELVVNVVKYEQELSLLRERGINIIRLQDIVSELQAGGMLLTGAAGAHLMDLVSLGRSQSTKLARPD
jgi:hypothetical protein